MNPNPGLNSYVIYYRVSTKQQGESGLGLQAQRAYVHHFYAGQPILAELIEVQSGKTLAKRPQLQKAITLCQQTGATLVVAKIDRLSRNTEQALGIYRQLEGRLQSCDIPHLDKFTLTLFMAIADRERELIGLRTKQALDQKRLRVGEWRQRGPNAKKAAAGLRGVARRKELAQDNEHSRRAMALIGSLRARGQSYPQIARQLNEAGFSTPLGGQFGATQVRRLYLRLSPESSQPASPST